MKLFKYFLRPFLAAIILLCGFITVNAQERDSLEISLVTCGPGDEAYSLYGHTAIRFHNITTGEDIAVNYGIFSFQKPYFVLRFVFGITDYEMGLMPWDLFLNEYLTSNRWVKEQRLNLTDSCKQQIAKALAINYQPENRVYRYNYFYDNCTTRARNIIANNIMGGIQYTQFKAEGKSFRNMIHAWTKHHLWARFGNDLLLGLKADATMTPEESQFLPVSLSDDFDQATISINDSTIKLVESTETYDYNNCQNINNPSENNEEHENTLLDALTPTLCSIFLLAITILICIIEIFTSRRLWGFDLLLFTIAFLCGIILTAMIFSQHPTVSLNLQIMLLNPLAIVPIIELIKHHKINQRTRIIALLFIILFTIGGIFQCYAEGMWIIVLSYTLRSGIPFATLKHK